MTKKVIEKLTNDPLMPMRHTAEHVLHTAMHELYPSIKLVMGPPIEDGFYFDFDLDEKVSPEDFPKIEKRMQEIIDANLKMEVREGTAEEVRARYPKNEYKLQTLEEIQERNEKITMCIMGDEKPPRDIDLCAGPHAKSTGTVEAFKLLSVAGAYYKGDEKNKMLQRIYGTAFDSKEKLENYLNQLEEARKRDHRKLGKELDLYSISDLTGPGLILWHPKLATVRNAVEDYWKQEHYKNDYQLVFTPHIASMDMFVKSRHYNKYINSMFPAMLHQYIEGESQPDYITDEQLKPMNCPNHIQIFNVHPRSYRELPLRMGELGTVYRYERAGTLHGMTRVRGFTQDDSHIFCTPDQVIEEVRNVLKLTKAVYALFGFTDYKAYIATRPEKYLGSLEMWDFAENSLKKAADAEGLDYQIDDGEGVFYGPKIDSKVKDSLGREWQLGTIQFDFNQPTSAESTQEDLEEFWAMKTFRDKFKTKENLWKYLQKVGRGFNVQYIDEKGEKKQVVMIHRTVLGSMERFFGVLIEHFGGAFPVWLSPIQIEIIPISEKHVEYAKKVMASLKEKGLRVEINDKDSTMGAKIREAQNQKVPYMLIVGDKEVESEQVSVRLRTGKDLGAKNLTEVIEKINSKYLDKSLDLW